MNDIKVLPSDLGHSSDHAPGGKRVCIVTGELEGPFFNGGVGTANRGLALALRRLGYDVHILYTQVSEGKPVCLRGTFDRHVEDYARHGIVLRAIFNLAPPDDWLAKSDLVMRHLIEERYDAAFLDDLFGSGYYALLARRTGAASLAATVMVVTAHGALEWVSEQDEVAILNLDTLPVLEMERRSIELADTVKAPSRYILDKYATYGWTLPGNTVVMPNFLPETQTGASDGSVECVKIDEIVFFGRLETRKGIWLFLRAIDRIKYRLAGRSVTFLGRSPALSAQILRHTLGWPFTAKLLPNFNREQALAYLRRPGCLAVMPSLEDNSPSTVLECLHEGIPFITSSGSGSEELIAPECHETNLFEPTVDKLADKLIEVIETYGSTAKRAFANEQLVGDFSTWLRRTLVSRQLLDAPGRTHCGPTAVIAFAAPGQSHDSIAAALGTMERKSENGAVVHVLADVSDELRDRLPQGIARIAAHGTLSEIAKCVAALRPRVVVLCGVDWVPGRDWLERAAHSFDADISALTGMRLAPVDPDAKEPKDTWFARARSGSVERRLIGNSGALLPLMQSTNSGFALLKHDVLGMLGSLDTLDRFGRVRPLCDIVHELMVAMVASGRRFELIPDLVGPPASDETPFASSSAGDGLQRAAERLGSPRAALWPVERLAVDAGIERIRTGEARAYRNALSLRAGFPIDAVDLSTPWDRHATDLARLAGATGRSDLAVELLTKLLPERPDFEGAGLSDFVDAAATGICLLKMYHHGSFDPVNLMHSYSLAWSESSGVQLHANGRSEPRAGIAFHEVDLARLGSFAAQLALPNAASRPVRFRIDMAQADGSEHFAAERILLPGRRESLRFELPPQMRTTCRAVVGVEMADPLAPNDHAYVQIASMRFLPLGREAQP